MLTNHISPFLISKIVSDFTPDFDLLNPLRCGMRCLVEKLILIVFVIGCWDYFIGLLQLLRCQID